MPFGASASDASSPDQQGRAPRKPRNWRRTSVAPASPGSSAASTPPVGVTRSSRPRKRNQSGRSSTSSGGNSRAMKRSFGPCTAASVAVDSRLRPGGSDDRCEVVRQLRRALRARARSVRGEASRSATRSARRWRSLLDGQPRASTLGGWADRRARGRGREDTIVNVYSTTKAWRRSACTSWSSREGSTSTRRWRATGRSSRRPRRATIPVRWLLGHRSGLAGREGAAAGRGALRLGRDDDGARGADAVVDAGREPRLSRGDVRLARRRDRAPRVGQSARHRTSARASPSPLGVDFHIGLADVEHDRVAEMSTIAAAGSRQRRRPARHGDA